MIDNIRLIAQSAIRIVNKGTIIYFDPYLINNCDNDADYIFITHSHYDHYSPEDIKKIIKPDTKIIVPKDLEKSIESSNILVVEPDKEYVIGDISFKTTRSYNNNKSFHKKEYNWVGYIVNIDNNKVYVSGDTDYIDEMHNINCDIAFVPIGGTYTMDYKEASMAINTIKPKLAIPTHYGTIVGSTKDAFEFQKLVDKNINVQIIKEDD